jgi:hypothetical protein
MGRVREVFGTHHLRSSSVYNAIRVAAVVCSEDFTHPTALPDWILYGFACWLVDERREAER